MPADTSGLRRGGTHRGPNKVGSQIKAMVAQALSNKGGVAYLELQADKEPAAFLGLVKQLMPKEVDANVAMDGPIEIKWIGERNRKK